MFAKIAEQITESMEDNHIIEHDDRELYVYGFNQGLNILLNLITTLVVGLLFGNVLELAIFIAAYIPLRSFAGGYHAKTPVRCYIVSIILILAFSLVIKYVHFTIFICSIVIVVSSAVILCLSPVEDKHKPFDGREQAVYRKKSLIILAVEMCLWLFMCLLLCKFEAIIPIVFITEAAILILGKVKNQHNDKLINK